MGKVHGGLAKVGKVRNQTPKVAKAEKQKPLTGRAKKRKIYNKRFMTLKARKMGKKAGPNCQQKI